MDDFRVVKNGPTHQVDDLNCNKGWCSLWLFRECECGGVIHVEKDKEWADNYGAGMSFHTKCDKCGTKGIAKPLEK